MTEELSSLIALRVASIPSLGQSVLARSSPAILALNVDLLAQTSSEVNYGASNYYYKDYA
jgi:hypothetical protein